MDILNKVNNFKSFINKKEGELDNLNQSIKEKLIEKENLELKHQRDLTKKMLIDISCQSARDEAKELLSSISTNLVQSVFDETTEVKFDITTKDSVASAEVVVLNEYDSKMVEIDPSNDDGGGLADVISLSLLMGLNQTLDNNYAPFILDEPSKYISKGELSENFAISFKDLVNLTGKQTIISTHDDFLLDSADTKYHIAKDWDKGISVATKTV
ncbi:MAG: chromosome partitioning protein ParA [Peptostreptococcaceae bacterium]